MGGKAFARLTSGVAAGLVALMSVGVAFAADAITGQPQPWEVTMQAPFSPIAEDIHAFHNLLLVIITIVSLFVLGLLVYVAVRFNEKANPVPSKVTHNSTIEVVWTVVPVIILVIIAIPSFRLLRKQETMPSNVDMTVKVTGNQWYWGIEYPEANAGFKFDALMLEDKDREVAIKAGKPAVEVPHLLAVDNELVVPVNKVVRIQVTAADVIHSFSVPALGFRKDAVPGRLNETWFQATKEGVYYGQCSRLCGKNHAFMPIAIRVVSDEKYAAWLADAKKKYAAIDGKTQVASTAEVR